MEEVSTHVLLCDGAMGTMLYSKGVYLNYCFDALNLTNPDMVLEVHADYVKAGADIIETNTFGANRLKLLSHGLEGKVGEINAAGVRLARQAAGKDVFVAGSIGPLGVRVEPWGHLSAEEAEEIFKEQATSLLEAGADLIILETFSDISEIHQAIKAVRGVDPNAVVIAQMTIGEDGCSLFGTTPEVFTARLEEWGANVVGVNCSVGPAHMLQCIERMVVVTSLPLSAMPNAGIPREVDGRYFYLCSPEYMAEYAKRFILTGVKVVGGCCGTTPAHTRAMRSAIKALQPPRRKVVHVHMEVEPEKVEQIVPLAEKSQLGRKIEEGEFVISVEVVPPRGPDASKAIEIARLLKQKGVDCVNIPDGPRATSRMSSMVLAALMLQQSEIEPLLHYTCRDRNIVGMQSDLLGMHALGIRNLLIITGDPPKTGDYPDATAVFDVDSIGLTRIVSCLNKGIDIGGRKLSATTNFVIGVGVNPGAINLDLEIRRFEEKIAAGAKFAITQPVFDLDLLEQFLRKIEHLKVPILGGIWPLVSLRNAEFMDSEVPGGRVPSDIMDRMRKAQEKGSEVARKEGVAIALETIEKIKGMVDGLQICTPLGRFEMVFELLEVL
ncbi:MAG: bifunctional homocysteine S-methyltransferase/methylenetetrahydrofolate reductase [bacterium]